MQLFVTNNGHSSALSVATKHGYAVASAMTGPWDAPRLLRADNGQLSVAVPNAVFVVTTTSGGVTIKTVRGSAATTTGKLVSWAAADTTGFAYAV